MKIKRSADMIKLTPYNETQAVEIKDNKLKINGFEVGAGVTEVKFYEDGRNMPKSILYGGEI